MSTVTPPRLDAASGDPTQRAIRLAGTAHSTNRWGEYPYLVHLALAATIARTLSDDPRVEAAAWLHDVLEDHPEYVDRLEAEFGDLVASLRIDSRRDGETYDEFIDRVIASGDRIAITVKLADMTSNLGNTPPERLRARYERNIARLREVVAGFAG
ncbi:HD domain-containing protein [Pseudoclavibacter caeni]|uniref:HD domain-containing protein n=1 Tax=Pseudoclavibacter caeni TaxID=908846 RepID=A0A7C8BQF9_9MICO|nr:HD domain-containing protein [Pseudoclavibacter caeni]KAB1631128.1 HD domain-containing protein [Pseudoclavibacter caeni]NYJ97406.1 (p)ppGpp synthase/HD superfamily hydrolase [Pseudoclavibacter caeni]